MLHSVPLLFSLLSHDPESSLLEDVLSGSDEGAETLDGRRLHRMRFVEKHFQWDLLTDESGSPWIGQADILVIGGTNRAFRYRVIAKFLDQQADPEISEDAFRFSPPEGAKQVKTFISAAHASAEPPNEMLGRRAPEVSLRFLSGETRELSSHRGTNVVVLDFWASWCPPCRRALPIVQELAKRWTSSNVVFYAVNRNEPVEKVKAFAEETGLDLPVVLDTDELAEGFAVKGIPHLVVIDTNGIIQFAHVGYSPNLGEELDGILTRVLAGQPVAASILEALEKEADKEAVSPKPYTPRPIPASPDAFTARDYRKLKAAFVRRQNTEFYLETRSTADGEDEILALLSDYERLLVGSDDPVPPASEFVDRARALIKRDTITRSYTTFTALFYAD